MRRQQTINNKGLLTEIPIVCAILYTQKSNLDWCRVLTKEEIWTLGRVQQEGPFCPHICGHCNHRGKQRQECFPDRLRKQKKGRSRVEKKVPVNAKRLTMRMSLGTVSGTHFKSSWLCSPSFQEHRQPGKGQHLDVTRGYIACSLRNIIVVLRANTPCLSMLFK